LKFGILNTTKMQFTFKAKTASGEEIRGIKEASDKFALAREMRSRGSTVLFAREVGRGKHFDISRLNEIVVRVKLKEKMIFANNLASMVGAGLSLARALKVLERQTRNKKLKRVICDLEDVIEKGGTLHGAMANNKKVFSNVFVAMVAAGEESGNLPEALSSIGDQMEKTYAIRRKVRGALIYPAMVLFAMIVIGILMMIYVVPTLADTFAEFGKELPPATRMVLATSNFLVNHTVSFVTLVIGFVLVMWRFTKLSFGKRTTHFLTLRIPLIGTLVRQVNAALVTRTMSSLVSSGVDMVRALEISRDVVQNIYYKNILSEAMDKVSRGSNLSDIFHVHENLFPPLVGEMAQVGEETGKLTEMLRKVAVFYEEEVENATKNMATIIEPFLMLLIGVAVGFFAISMIQPIYSLSVGV